MDCFYDTVNIKHQLTNKDKLFERQKMLIKWIESMTTWIPFMTNVKQRQIK